MSSKEVRTNRLLRTYLRGSVFILTLCLFFVSIVLSALFLQREHSRLEISVKQLSHSLNYQYRRVSEEVWTGSYDSIQLRYKDVANQFGQSSFGMAIVDPSGHCLSAYSEISGYPKERFCEEAKAKQDQSLKSNDGSTLFTFFDSKLGLYRHEAKISVGTVYKGFVWVGFSDPYRFERRSVWTFAMTYAFPVIFIVLSIWILWLAFARRRYLTPYIKQLVQLEQNRTLGDLAAQVAHDIKSPLSALNSLTAGFQNLRSEETAVLKAAIERINGIANSLIAKQRSILLEESYGEPLSPLIQKLVTEKRAEYQERTDLEITFDPSAHQYLACSGLSSAEIQRVLSNLINNAIEAMPNGGKVWIELDCDHANVVLRVFDNGPGLPTSIESRIMEKGVTYGKKEGTGLGLYSARELIRKAKGSISIQSRPRTGVGLAVEIRVPKTDSSANQSD